MAAIKARTRKAFDFHGDIVKHCEKLRPGFHNRMWDNFIRKDMVTGNGTYMGVENPESLASDWRKDDDVPDEELLQDLLLMFKECGVDPSCEDLTLWISW